MTRWIGSLRSPNHAMARALCGAGIGLSGPATAFDHISWIGTVPEPWASGTSFMTLLRVPPAKLIGMSPISSLGVSSFTQGLA